MKLSIFICLVSQLVRADILVNVAEFGNFGAIDRMQSSSPYSTTRIVNPINHDFFSRIYNNKIYTVEANGRLRVFDPSNGATLKDVTLDPASGPHDVIVTADETTAFVSAYDQSRIYRINLATQTVDEDFIDLSIYADSDGIAELDKMIRIGNRGFVTVQNLSRPNYTPTGNSMVIVFDLTNNSVIDTISLTFQNPVTPFHVLADNNLAVGGAGAFGVADGGGIEVINPTTLESVDILTTEDQLGGDVSAFDIRPDYGKGWALVTAGFSQSNLVAFNPTSGAPLQTKGPYPAFAPQDVAYDSTSHLIYMSYSEFGNPTGAVYILSDLDLHEITPNPISFSPPPRQVQLIPISTPTSTESFAVRFSLHPNPTFGEINLFSQGLGQKDVKVDIYDVRGRKMGSTVSVSPVQKFSLGREPAGVYMFRITTNGKSETHKVTRIERK